MKNKIIFIISIVVWVALLSFISIIFKNNKYFFIIDRITSMLGFVSGIVAFRIWRIIFLNNKGDK
jgi:cell shape-determining protein MreC